MDNYDIIKDIPIKELKEFLTNQEKKKEFISGQWYAQAADCRDKEKFFLNKWDLPSDFKIDIIQLRDEKLRRILL